MKMVGKEKNPSANPGVCVSASLWVHVRVCSGSGCVHAVPCINLCKLEKAFRMSQVYFGQFVHMQVCFKGCGRLHEDVQVWCDRGVLVCMQGDGFGEFLHSFVFESNILT